MTYALVPKAKSEREIAVAVRASAFRLLQLVARSFEEDSRAVPSARADNMAETREVMDIRGASQYVGVSRGTLYRYVYQETIPAFKLGGRWKFKKAVLDRWMEKQSTRSGEGPKLKAR